MKVTGQLLIAMSLYLNLMPAAQAQGLEAGAMGSMSQSHMMGYDHDSLLPPEVVPMDPNMASAASASQAQTREFDLGAVDNVPAASIPGMQGGQQPQDIRKAAFDTLYNQGQAPNLNQAQWRAGQQPQFSPGMQGPQQMAAHSGPQGFPAQTQTLTAGPKNQPVRRDTRRAGFTNALSYATTFGAGALTSAVLMRPNNPWLGAGIFGLAATGIGNRNGFRF